MIKSKLVVTITLALVFLAFIIPAALNQHAQSTYLQSFYKQAESANQHSKNLSFPGAIETINTTARDGKGRPGIILSNCVTMGYHYNHETGQTRLWAPQCHRGYLTYYRLARLDEATIDQAVATMTGLGWELESDNPQWVKDYLLKENQSDRGYLFVRDDGTHASLTFYNTKGSVDGSSHYSWCSSRSCRALEQAAKDDQYFMGVEIYAAYKDE